MMREVTRAEHLEWCKKRAIEYCHAGDVNQAWASMCSDMSKHEETARHAGLELGTMLLFGGHNQTPSEMKKFIEGFN